ncbi:hypothetical protein JVT61DRAFT_833 [Boletus reticuloceps]|uniref:P-loop containing nucleoside triphosphate hydrolase protein n=1 Tax=Boletus reticuloceps TaxID=495285 RepID=A0A8I2Z3D5_9AGAM|nr:hypothetical protein JVT61DRAFT_833 [Boletus reticuloceps]
MREYVSWFISELHVSDGVVLSADFENQGAHTLAKEYDPDGKRTVGVLTKPDRIPPGDEPAWVKILRNETEPLVNNWYCVKQPSSQDVARGITYLEARRRENEWFASTPPWSSLEPQYQRFLRTSYLTERLSLILSELIAKRLPKIQEELMNVIQETQEKLQALPKPPSSDPVGEVLQTLRNFERDLEHRVEGTPEEDGLLQTILPCQEVFKISIRRTAPQFVPWGETSTRELPEPAFLSNEHAAMDFGAGQNKIFVDEVLKRAQHARTRELPDNYPFVVQRAYIKEITQKWSMPAMNFFEDVYAILKYDLAKLVDAHFAHMGNGNAKQAIQMIVNDHLDEAAIRTKDRIQWLLELEQNPTTLNTHYYADYRDKFLAYYKAAPDHSDLLTMIQQGRSPTINGILSGLNDLGISATPTDLPKLLPADPKEAALTIMASVRAYFQVAYKRFVDMVPMTIDHEIVLGIQKGIYRALQEGLQITGPEGQDRCKSMLEERISVVTTRQETQDKMQRLQAARQELRRLIVQTDIDLPMIAVIGNQSAGKSSLIESISGITLPRSAGTCTRCPTECKLSHSDLPWSCVITLHFHTDSMGVPIPVCLVPFGSPIASKSLVEDHIRRAQRAILNPSQHSDDYLHDSFPEDNELSFSKNYVSLEISGKDLADLSFVDLPGLIASVGARGDDRDIELVKSLVTSYIEKPSCVILLTVACETDFENQGAYHLAKSFDPQGKRTVGVLTKPDRIPAGEEHRWLKIIRNETEPLTNNWYCVRQPSSQVLSSGITWAEARRQEEDYFTITQPWCSLESQSQNYLRTRNLTERLSIILSELVAKRLPEIQDELVNTIRETEADISKLPRAPSNDPVSEVLQALNAFSRELFRRVEGTPDANGLLQTIRPHQQAFRRAIRSTAPVFVPWEKKKIFFKTKKGKVEDAEDVEEVDNQTRPAKKIRIEQHIHIDEVLERAASACTRELPDSYPFVVQQAFIKEFTMKWRQPSMDLFDRVYTILKVDVVQLVEEHFAHMGKGLAKQSVLMIVNDHLDRAAIQTKAKIEWLLSLEQVPTTLNTHYFSDYKDKFLAFYRARRNNNDLMSKLKQAETTTQMQSTSMQPSPSKRTSTFGSSDPSQRDAIYKALSALSELALHIMASVRGYFQVAYKRFADMVPMAIDHEIILGLQRGIDEALREGLQITGPDGYSRCKSIVEEFSTIASARQELQKKMERLQAARQELRKLM